MIPINYLWSSEADIEPHRRSDGAARGGYVGRLPQAPEVGDVVLVHGGVGRVVSRVWERGGDPFVTVVLRRLVRDVDHGFRLGWERQQVDGGFYAEWVLIDGPEIEPALKHMNLRDDRLQAEAEAYRQRAGNRGNT